MSKRSEIIADFIAKLSVDPALRRRFKDDPSSLKGESGLSDEELELLTGGGPDQVLHALGGDATVNCMILFTSEAG